MQPNPNKAGKPVAETKQETPKPTAPQTTEWNVMVRHSSFLLKKSDVKGVASPEAAKAKFLELVRARHDERANALARNRGLDTQTIRHGQDAIRAALDQGMELDGLGKLEWIIRPAADVKAEREAIENRRQRLYGEPAGV